LRTRPSLLPIVIIAFLLAATRVYGGCNVRVSDQRQAERWFDQRWLVTYDGDIGGELPVRMTLVFDGDTLTGRYFYLKHLRNIDLLGKVQTDRSVELRELNEAGAMTAIFSGHFLATDPRGNYKQDNSLICEVLAGTWTEVATNRALPFYFRLQFATVGKLGNRYGSWSGARNDEASVEAVAQKFVAAFRDDRRSTVAAMLHYPMHVSMGDGTSKRIANRGQLLLAYDQAFPQFIRDSILNSVPMHMPLGKYELIRIGRIVGPWIGPDMKIWVNGADP
jgi:hypothetical protein